MLLELIVIGVALLIVFVSGFLLGIIYTAWQVNKELEKSPLFSQPLVEEGEEWKHKSNDEKWLREQLGE
jgi:hypothetical protein